MTIKNLTQDKVLAQDCKENFGKVSQLRGLMFNHRKVAMVFSFYDEQIVRLHMMFVFYPIDVLFLNKHKIVVEIKHDFKPFRFYRPKNKAKYVVELPGGCDGTRVWDVVEW